MGHRRGIKQDSLELLLDTICNTFGGVLFIAILVVMLLAQAGNGTGSAEPTMPVPSPEELEARSRELAALSAEVLRQEQIRVSQSALVETLVPDSIHELIERRKELLAEQSRLQHMADDQQAQNTVIAANVTRIQAEIDKTLADLKAAQKREAEARTLLASEEKARVKEARLPQQREARSKREIIVILRYGRLYVWHDYDLRLFRTGLNTRDFVVISDDGDELITRPKPTAGIPLDDSPECQKAIDKLLRRFSPKDFALGVIVRPDSYGKFQYFRNRAIALKYDYRVLPATNDSRVFDRGGSGGKVQ